MTKIEQEVVQKLKTETKNLPAAEGVFYLLAIRERTRGTLTLGALSQKMRQEGFDYSNDEYRKVLGIMSKAGIGTPVKNRVGNCIGIKDIKVNLAELGTAACTEATLAKVVSKKEAKALEAAPMTRRYSDRPVSKSGISIKPITSLEVSINGLPAVIQFPKGLTGEDLSALMNKLQGTTH